MPATTPIPAATIWYGDELYDRPDWAYELTGADVAELEAALDAAAQTPLEKLDPASFKLPTMGNKLIQIQDALENQSGVTRITGFPYDRYSPATVERMFWGMMRYIGTPVSQSGSGERIFHVRDAGFGDEDVRTRGPNTKKRLSFHTDRCDVIGFMCMQPALEGGENFVVSSAALYLEIQRRRPDLLDCLSEPLLYKRHTVDTGNEHAYCQQPVFSFCDGYFACSFLRVLIERAYASPDTPQMSDKQREALDFLEEVAEEPSLHVRFHQQRGDILLLNNWTTLHRRSAFVDHDDPALKRHLLRIWLSVPNSRPLDPLFRDNFGAVEAGAVRGGMRARSEEKRPADL